MSVEQRIAAVEYELDHRAGRVPTLEDRVDELEASVKRLASALDRVCAVLQARFCTAAESGDVAESEPAS